MVWIKTTSRPTHNLPRLEKGDDTEAAAKAGAKAFSSPKPRFPRTLTPKITVKIPGTPAAPKRTKREGTPDVHSPRYKMRLLRKSIVPRKLFLTKEETQGRKVATTSSAPKVKSPRLHFDEQRTLDSLKLGEDRTELCMSPKNQNKVFEQFLETYPGTSSMVELQLMGELDVFQWWMYTDSTIKETLECMRTLVLKNKSLAQANLDLATIWNI